MKNYYKIAFGLVATYLLFGAIMVEVLYCYKIEDGYAMWISICIFIIMSLVLFISIFKIQSLKNKEKMKIARVESTINKHGTMGVSATKKYLIIKKYQLITTLLIIAVLIMPFILLAIYKHVYKIDDWHVILAFIPELLLIFFLFRIQSLKEKKMMEFVLKESTLKHTVPKITREQVLERLKENGFETYYVHNNVQIGLQLVNIKENVIELSCCYAFLIFDENMADEKVFKDNGELYGIDKELNQIIDDYLEGKKMYRHSIISPIICFVGEQLSDKAMNKCSKAFNLNKHELYIGYETYSENIYYAEGIEQLDIPYWNVKTKWIREIFQINDDNRESSLV